VTAVTVPAALVVSLIVMTPDDTEAPGAMRIGDVGSAFALMLAARPNRMRFTEAAVRPPVSVIVNDVL
jgi:hypothetical protein